MHFKFIKEATVILVFAAASAILYNSFSANGLAIIYTPVEIQPGSMIDLSGLDRLLRLQKAVLIDVRTKNEFNEGHIPDALNLPLKSSRITKIEFLSNFPKNKIFILYCTNPECTQAERLAKQFNLRGFNNTHIFSGGWDAWQEAGLDAK